ncbi:MAG: ribulose-phosphate 3-epimerase [Candidatus Binatia bacterium]
MNTVKIAPSILSADFSRLKDEIQAVEAAGADWLHVDVMDGHFVPNITIGPVVVEWVRKVTEIPLDVHLMITDPNKYSPEFISAGADWISIHPETSPDPNSTLRKIRALGAKASVAVNPDVPLAHVESCFQDADMILIMSVFPGFAGQTFIPEVLPKIAELRKLIDKRKLPIKVEVDGGIKADNIDLVVRAGAEVIVSGSGIFRTSNYAVTIAEMRRAAEHSALGSAP